MRYSKKQELLTALNAGIAEYERMWPGIVDATNELCKAIEAGDESYDACFPPEIERAIDDMAHKTAWIYSRLESVSKYNGKRSPKIRKALGYNG